MKERAVVVVCRPELAHGFALAGVAAHAAATPDDGAARVRALLAERRDQLGLILVDEAIHAAFTDELRSEIARHALPIVIPFAGPTWTAETAAAEAYVAELLGRAVGYRVRLR